MAVVGSLGMTYVSIPMPYPIHAISDDQVARFAELLEKGDRPMLLHCSSGNRVSGLWAVWLVEHGGVSADEARRAQNRNRPSGASVHEVLDSP